MAVITSSQTAPPDPITKSAALPKPSQTQASSVSRLVLGPLTQTTWTPPASCTNVHAACETCSIGWQAQTCADKGYNTDDQACWPPTTQGIPKTSQGLNGWGVYSPGLACPNGYTSAVASTYGSNNNFAFQFPLNAGETAIGCCPEADDGGPTYFMTSAYGFQTCLKVATAGPVSPGSCQARGVLTTATSTLPFAAGPSPLQTVVSTYFIFAPLFQVVRHSSDMPGYSAPSNTDVIGSNSNDPTQSTSGASSPAGPGLSAGAQAGIGIGAALAAIALGLAVFLWWRRRQESPVYTSALDGAHAAGSHPSIEKELYQGGDAQSTGQLGVTAWQQNPQGGYYSELSSEMDPSELHSQSRTPVPSPPVELGAGNFYDSLAYSHPTDRTRR